MSTLFETKPPPPLAEALRPSSIAEVIGQSHLLAHGKPLQLAFASGKPHCYFMADRAGESDLRRSLANAMALARVSPTKPALLET